MNFTKTPPTEPGNYWWRQHSQCKPECRMVFDGHVDMLLTMHPWGRSEVSDSIGEWGDRIEFPGEKVPDDVAKAVASIRYNMRKMIGLNHSDAEKLCDYIDPPNELPLPRRFRGKWRGVSCVGAVSDDGKILTQMADGGCSYAGRNIGEIESLEWIDGEQP